VEFIEVRGTPAEETGAGKGGDGKVAGQEREKPLPATPGGNPTPLKRKHHPHKERLEDAFGNVSLVSGAEKKWTELPPYPEVARPRPPGETPSFARREEHSSSEQSLLSDYSTEQTRPQTPKRSKRDPQREKARGDDLESVRREEDGKIRAKSNRERSSSDESASSRSQLSRSGPKKKSKTSKSISPEDLDRLRRALRRRSKARKGKRGGNYPSDSSSSSSSSSESDSSESTREIRRKRKRARKRSSKKTARRRRRGSSSSDSSSQDNVFERMAELLEVIKETSRLSRKSILKKEEQKKATTKWLPISVFVFKVLSAEDGWHTHGVPALGEFAEQLIDMKIVTATSLIRFKAKHEHWKGGILKSGLSDFLMRGFDAEDVDDAPSGFSVLFFHCSKYSESDGAEFVAQRVRESFGDGEMDDVMIKMFSNLQIFLPSDTHKAEEQLDTASKFLKAVCGQNTIASGGYEAGAKTISRHRRRFEIAMEMDKLLLIKFLYFLDRLFQHMVQQIILCEDERDPVQSLRTKLRGKRWMEKQLEKAMDEWSISGQVPKWGLPHVLLNRGGGRDGLVDI